VTATLPEAPPVVDWRQRALIAERKLEAVLDVCWVLDGQRHAPTYGIAARRVRAAIAEAEQEPEGPE
jgi:hypothetical protein